MTGWRQQISDGYHTFEELYDHRHALFLALARALRLGWKSKVHNDGTMYDGWFIAGIPLPTGKTITYHLPMSLWELTPWLIHYIEAPPWDGHTSEDVVQRLLEYSTSSITDLE